MVLVNMGEYIISGPSWVLISMVWYGMLWYGMVWYGMIWYAMVQYDMVWPPAVVEQPHQSITQRPRLLKGSVPHLGELYTLGKVEERNPWTMDYYVEQWLILSSSSGTMVDIEQFRR